ncbi:hypothetical protein B6D87_08120 [Pseudomonas fragi]|uniref:glycosyltransferase n=1 Tax=Pseudomonas fragi TaxID=296 RepID=UPI000A2A024D|nr:glycosyltransferase [Pseudomonas fragi]ARQ74181.1 hypothetical protein B6D87_08120 [Pseudomonas fragi]
MKGYLFVYPSLSLGGIETFFVRLAKQLDSQDKRLKFLFLFKGHGNEELMGELKKYADVYYWEDICLFGTSDRLHSRLKLFLPLKKKQVSFFLSGCEVVHVSCPLTFFIAMRLFSSLGVPAKLVFGVYHSNELAWGKDEQPFYEKYFRRCVFKKKRVMLLFFNDASKQVTLRNNGLDTVLSKTFPLGVDLAVKVRGLLVRSQGVLRIVSVGRLTEFKTYNIHMLDVVRELINKGFNVRYDIYGSGPLQAEMLSKITRLDLEDHVALKGDLRYSLLDETLIEYDVFVGTGTALIHAAANGVPCLTAIENEPSASTYGFFSELQGAEYHEQNLDYEKKSMVDVLLDYDRLSAEERAALENRHFLKSSVFGIGVCTANFQDSFESAPAYKVSSYPFYIYMVLFFIAEFVPRLIGKSAYRKKYNQVI